MDSPRCQGLASPPGTHLNALNTQVEVDSGERLDRGHRSLEAERGAEQRHLARISAVVSQTSAAVVAREALAAAVHAPAGGAGGGSAEGREGEGEGVSSSQHGLFEPECRPRYKGRRRHAA